MSKRFTKTVVASTISLILLGVKENAWGMMGWRALDEEDKKSMIEMHQGHLGHKPGSPDFLVTMAACRYWHQMDRYHNSEDAAMRDCRICRESIGSMVEKTRRRREKIHEKCLNQIRKQDLKEENEELRNSGIKNPVIEEGTDLVSTIQELRKINIQSEEKINNLDAEKESLNILILTLNNKIKDLKEERNSLYSLTTEQDQSTEIINEMMKIIGVNTDDFSDCTGNVFAQKCLDQLKSTMGLL